MSRWNSPRSPTSCGCCETSASPRGKCQGRSIVYALYDDPVAQLLDQAVFYSEHLRLGAHDRPVAAAEASG
jgi:hypothetical protein